jgi:nucleotide-binding universal stress UspA family protein
MIRSILLALAEAPDDAAAKNYAFWLAKNENNRIHAMVAIDIAAFEAPVLGTADGLMPSVVAPPLKESRSLMNDLMTMARDRLDQFTAQCASRNVSCSTEVKTGIPGEVISRAGVAHDITVVSRTGYNRVANTQETVDALVAPVIRNSVRPVLVAGSEFREESGIQNILVAYDGSIHAARALRIAAELAARPGAKCTLITVAHSEEEGRDVLASAEAYLLHHDVEPAKKVAVGSKPSAVICDLVASGSVDIVIMGAYGHSPIREVLFGSTTERILSNCAANAIFHS